MVRLRWRIEFMRGDMVSFELIPCGAALLPPLPPRPFTPAGVKGSFNSRFDLCASNTELLAGGCDTGWMAPIGARCGRSQRQGRMLTNAQRRTSAQSASAATRDTNQLACKVRASARAGGCSAVWTPPPLERAEQHSVGRIRAGACLRRKPSLRTTPTGASSARNPAGARSTARLLFAYFLLAKQEKVSRLPGRDPASQATQTPT
jgi:hypothetical protein